MLKLKNEVELNKLGLKIHSSDPTQAVPLNEPTNDTLPDASWTLDRLGQFAAANVAESKRLQREVVCLARKSTVQVFWAGCALTFAQRKIKATDKKWGDWLKERAIPRTNAWEAMELFRLAETVEAVADLTLTQAKQKFGITKPPKDRTTTQPKEKATQVKKQVRSKPTAPKEHRNPDWPVIANDEPHPNIPPPPAKENPNSPLTVLVKVRGRLAYLQDEIKQVDWKTESAKDYRTVLEEIIAVVQQIATEVPNNVHKYINQILCCDCVEGMKRLSNECIPLTVTSPPYDKLRKYGGHPFNFEAVAQELYRITMPGGIVVWIVQDQVVDGGETGTSFQQALHFQSVGFRLHSTMLMVANGGKLPHRTRYVPQFHYAFVLSKGRPRYVNLIHDRRNTTKAKRKEWNARRENGELVSGQQSPRDTPPFSERGNVWHYNVGYNQTTKDKDAFDHPALMAEAMAEDHILSWSRPGDLVLDPFCGAGTTCKMALVNDRHYLGMEIHKPYHKLAVKRVNDARAEHRQRLDAYFQIGVPEPPSLPTLLPTNRRISCRTAIKRGDVVAVSQKLDASAFDGCLYDGPYGLTSIGKRFGKRGSKPPKTNEGTDGAFGRLAAGFMGQTWDGGVPSVEACREFLRVCKPGSWMLAFGHPRTWHRLACNIEDAGWEIRDTLMWLYGTGFPKSHDLGKKMNDDAWLGYGSALKPGYEPVIVAMKPLEGSFADNARKWGVAGLNIDGCRIPCTGKAQFPMGKYDNAGMFGVGAVRDGIDRNPAGRFPANVILDEDAARLLDLQSPIRKGGKYRKTGKRDRRHKGQQLYGGGIGGGQQNAPDCYGDAGGASRFFYCPKANHEERNAGLDDFPIDRPDKRSGKGLGIWDKKGVQPQQNHHPCVKPIALTEYLARLILPPKRSEPRKLLVPYSGSGSEMIGAMLAGWDEVLGIEQDKNYVEIARARIKRWRAQ